MTLDFGPVVRFAPALVDATVMTIFLAIVSQAIGTVAGLLLALARMSPRFWLRYPALVYIWVARGTPALIHLFFIYYALPTFGIRFEPVPAAILAFSISSAAYNAEILRAGLNAVAVGQIEAARAVGMTYPGIVRHIVLPQAVRIIIPPYMSNFISHVKNTSLASVVTVRELMLTTQMIYTTTFRAMEALLVTGTLYLVLTSLVSLGQLWLERLFSFEDRRLSPRRLARLGLGPDGTAPAAEPIRIVAAAAPQASREVLAVSGLSKSFGQARALAGVSVRVKKSEVVCVLGPSGSGKSTLLRCINLLEAPDAGRIGIDEEGARFDLNFDGGRHRASGRELARLRSSVGMVFQHFNLWPHKIALENVTEGLVRVRGTPPREAAEIGKAMLARVGLADKMTAFPQHLSGGQRQRVAIARALAMRPKVMLFDEPTSALDPELVGEVLQVIEDVAESGMTMLVATHEMGFARRVADRILFMDKGQIIEDAPTEEFFTQSRHERSSRFLGAILRG
jgi:polar amino acid transport system permease protein